MYVATRYPPPWWTTYGGKLLPTVTAEIRASIREALRAMGVWLP